MSTHTPRVERCALQTVHRARASTWHAHCAAIHSRWDRAVRRQHAARTRAPCEAAGMARDVCRSSTIRDAHGERSETDTMAKKKSDLSKTKHDRKMVGARYEPWEKHGEMKSGGKNRTSSG